MYAKKLNLEISKAELKMRLKKWEAPKKVIKGYLARYSKLASSADNGAVLL